MSLKAIRRAIPDRNASDVSDFGMRLNVTVRRTRAVAAV